MSYTLLATGDLMLTRQPVVDQGSQLQPIWQMLAGADHVFANLEEVLTNRTSAADKMVCQRGAPELAEQLPRLGIDVVTLANNHALDYGIGGLEDTIRSVNAAGVKCVGAGLNLQEALIPAVLSTDDRRVAFLGFASTLPLGSAAGSQRAGIAPIRVVSRFVVDATTIDEGPGIAPFVETIVMPGELDVAARAVSEAREQADLVIVAVHWGIPHGWVAQFQSELATYQQPLAHALIDAGADAIIGHHSHVLHGIEMYHGRPIFYSLGNFLFHSLDEGDPSVGRTYPEYTWDSLHGDLTKYGGVARLVWDESLARVELVPVWLNEVWEPMLVDEQDVMPAVAALKHYSRKFDTQFRHVQSSLAIDLG